MCGSELALAQLRPRTQYTAASSVTAVSTTCAPIDLPAFSVRLFALLICSHQGERKRGTHRHSHALVHYFWRPARFCRPTARFSAALPHPVVWILIFSIVFSEGCEEEQASGLTTFSLLMPLAGCMDGWTPFCLSSGVPSEHGQPPVPDNSKQITRSIGLTGATMPRTCRLAACRFGSGTPAYQPCRT